ncbi:MAG: C69 family dipeptidase [Bacteroidales bacterium]|jgi:dipeptidase|nr:C69 family dipeptidase [Bacteroidales bacterium]
MKRLLFLILTAQCSFLFGQTNEILNFPDLTYGMECTSVTVGKQASSDGSVMTSHSDDSGRTRTNILVEKAKDFPKGTMKTLYKRRPAPSEKNKMPKYEFVRTGVIPEAEHTYQYFNSAYPCLNEKQLAIGESTFGGRSELKSDSGLIDCTALCMLIMERCATAREAITMAGELLKKYGWNDDGECLTIADKNEVWHLEIVGPGKGKVGAVWAAQRVPDDHVGVNANASTIRAIDLKNKNYFMASDNIYTVAEENGWYDKKKETFQFAYAYAPATRTSVACRRREWRVFDLLAPSLKLDPNSENYPFSVKPDSLVKLEDMVRVFKDYYEGTEYDMRKTLTVTDKEGKTTISPFANPFMKTDEMKLHKINGGWNWRGERNIAVYFTIYATILQCRSFLPDEVGGLCWLALDNVASSIYVPFYASIKDFPETYKTCGRETGFSQKAAWWAFNRLGTIAAKRWGDMSKVVDAAWKPMQAEFFAKQSEIERNVLQLLQNNKREEAINFLTKYSCESGDKAVKTAWETGDLIWTIFDGSW